MKTLYKFHRTAMAAVAVLLLSANVAMAQDDSLTVEQRAKERTEKMKLQLCLKPDQVNQVYRINLEAAKKMDNVLDGKKKYMEAYNAGKDVDKERDQKLMDVLTPGQWSDYQRIEHARSERKRNKVKKVCRI